MSHQVNTLLPDKFLRSYCELFTARDMEKFLSQMGIKASSKEVEDFLETHPLVFPLEKNFYITRAGAFTKEYFSIKLTPCELVNKTLIPGDRCIPFVDSEILSSTLQFYFNDIKLPNNIIKVDSDNAIDMFVLYGEEYAPQYIAADPANSDLDLVDKEFALPNQVSLTGVDLSILFEQDKFSRNDRLLCYVADWDSGKINISIIHDTVDDNPFNKGELGEQQLRWYSLLEQFLLDSFDRLGPCSTIEEQLADVFFEHRKELCVKECGSVEEFLNMHTKKVSVEYFGVETRLWKKGELVPAVGKWNERQLNLAGQTAKQIGEAEHYLYSMPSVVLDQYLIDMNYRKETNISNLLDRIFSDELSLSSVQRKSVMLQLEQRNDILRKKYNWFADQTCGPVRQRSLALYARVAMLVLKIDCIGNTLDEFPQQELVILSQLYSHITRIIESVANNDHIDEDSEAIMLSLEGMELNFEDIEDELEFVVSQENKKKFTIIK